MINLDEMILRRATQLYTIPVSQFHLKHCQIHQCRNMCFFKKYSMTFKKKNLYTVSTIKQHILDLEVVKKWAIKADNETDTNF